MTNSVELKVVELLCSRLCHELVGSAGAVGNGIELIKDSLEGSGTELPGQDDMTAEALTLVEKSAEQVINRLKFYRLAYGYAGRMVGNIAELRSVVQGFVGEGRVKLSWPLPPILPDLRDGDSKLLLNLIALALEGLPRGGEISIDMTDDEIRISLLGEDCMIHPEMKAALEQGSNLEDLNPRNVHGLWIKVAADNAGRKISFESKTDNHIDVVVRDLM